MSAWVEDFHRDGWAKPGILLDEGTLAELRAATDRRVEESRAIMGVSLENWARLLSQIRGPERAEPAFAALQTEPRILAAGEAVLGAPVRVVDVQIVLKSPLSRVHVPYHQDFPTWNLENAAERGVAVWISLDDVDEHAGALRYLPGSHRERRDVDSVTVPVPAGEVLLHHARVWHATGPNLSREWRRACILLVAREL